MPFPWLLPALLVVAVVAAVARLAWRWSHAPALARSAPWRQATLIAFQPIGAISLYRALAPPPAPAAGTLVVATRRADQLPLLAAAGPVVALPEAGARAGIDRVPDLATALRRFRPARLRIVGDGLTPRDREAARGLAIDFAPSPAPVGLIRLDPPAPVAAGGAFRIGGAVGGVARASVDLIDPSGRRVDTTIADRAGNFVAAGAARAAGPVAFTLRVRDGTRTVETADVPVWTDPATAQRLFLLAAAPGPETKFLRRWASDAGLTVRSRFATGAGVTLGDTPVTLNAATLAGFDLAVADARSWAALSVGERAAVVAAVRGGLGLIVRIDGPLDDRTRAALAPLGFTLAGGDATTAIVVSRFDAPTAIASADAGAPPRDAAAADATSLSRWNVRVTAPLATPLARDARGTAIATWRPDGEGRIAVWPLADSYRLVLAGDEASYGELWSAVFATVGRGAHRHEPSVSGDARIDRRVMLCGLDGETMVVAPDGRRSRLLIDPAAERGCAGYWPSVAGWHRLARANGNDDSAPFYVIAADALPNVGAQSDREATRQLAAEGRQSTAAAGAPQATGGPWPWALAWLLVSAATWWFERSRFGVTRGRTTQPADAHEFA